jgi:hypothetical protein
MVEVGQVNDRYAEITNGLLPGDSVVTRGGYSLAFAGGGSVSLKAALDAAHGHEHAADGSELTADAKKAQAGGKEGDAHGHEEGEGDGNTWKIVSGVLGALLVVSLLRGRKSKDNEDEDETTSPKNSNKEAM